MLVFSRQSVITSVDIVLIVDGFFDGRQLQHAVYLRIVTGHFHDRALLSV